MKLSALVLEIERPQKLCHTQTSTFFLYIYIRKLGKTFLGNLYSKCAGDKNYAVHQKYKICKLIF